MNQLSFEKRVEIINHLVEGNSMRATSRLVKCNINTVMKLLVDVGIACMKFHDEQVVNVKARRVQVDEIWNFVYCKKKNVHLSRNHQGGDVWTWTAIDSETKLIIAWLEGKRDMETGYAFIQNVASRLSNRVQLTSDGLNSYLDAVGQTFNGDIDFAQLVKIYGKPTRNGKRDNRVQYVGSSKTVISGAPDEKYISTSIVERQNLTMRMHIRRFTRKTNAFSKKLMNHRCATAIHFVYYNFVRVHTTTGETPAMTAGIIDRQLIIADIVNLSYRSWK